MFNRALQVKVIKSKKEEPLTPTQTDVSFETKVAVLGYYVEKAVAKVGTAAITYVVLDTVRQVMVAKASRRI